MGKRKIFLWPVIGIMGAFFLILAGPLNTLAQDTSCEGRTYVLDPNDDSIISAGNADKFVNPLPNALNPGFVFRPNPGQSNLGKWDFEIGAYEIEQQILPSPFGPTTVWGYGQSAANAHYPAMTIIANSSTNPADLDGDQPDHNWRKKWGKLWRQKWWEDKWRKGWGKKGNDQNTAYRIYWTNQLVNNPDHPTYTLPHLLPIDSTLTWADPLNVGKQWGPYCGPVPIVMHQHGGHTDSLSDGLPDAWFTPDISNKLGPFPGNGHSEKKAGPDYWGRMYNPIYDYDHSQEAATVWYHDHALGITRLNVMAGLAGFYIIRDDNEVDLGLPGSPYSNGKKGPWGAPTDMDSLGNYREIAFVIQDRMFHQVDGKAELFYPSILFDEMNPSQLVPGVPSPTILPEFFGDFYVVNGVAFPKLEVEANVWYRLRILDGADSSFYGLSFDGLTFYQIGTDLGFLDSPVQMDHLVIGPGERADILIKFASTGTVTLTNDAGRPYNGETMDPEAVMQFVVSDGDTEDDFELPTDLRPTGESINDIKYATDSISPRELILYEATNSYGRLEPMLGTAAQGVKRYDDAITELIESGATEVWNIYNFTPDVHPIHLHLVHFFILQRQFWDTTSLNGCGDPLLNEYSGKFDLGCLANYYTGGLVPPAENEIGLKDTMQAFPNSVTTVIARFDKDGEYVWHCHILPHEDHEMMRPFFVGPGPRVGKGLPWMSMN